MALKHLPAAAIGVIISAVTLAFSILFLSRVRLRFPIHPLTEPAIGSLSGVLGGGISESGPPVVVYGLAQGRAKDVFRSSLLAYFLCPGAAAALSYAALGMVNGRLLQLAAVGLLPGLAAAHLGLWLKQRTSEPALRLAVPATVIAVGVTGLLKYLVC